MLLRYIHAIITEQTSTYGPFKLRGTEPQFKAALALYHLFLDTGGDDLDPQADLKIHHLFEMLLCSTGVNDRAINYPTDQSLFLWALLSDRTYRIPNHIQSLLAAAKYCFRCIALQIARIQVQGDGRSPRFEDIELPSPTSGLESGTDDNRAYERNTSSHEDGATNSTATHSMDADEALQWLKMRYEAVQSSTEGT